jgi:hypothetical protein
MTLEEKVQAYKDYLAYVTRQIDEMSLEADEARFIFKSYPGKDAVALLYMEHAKNHIEKLERLIKHLRTSLHYAQEERHESD